MDCAKNSTSYVDASKLTRQEMMKLFMSIDRTLIREAERTEKVSNLSELDQVITELMRADIPDSDIDAIAGGNKVLILPGEVTQEVSVKTGKVLQSNAVAVQSISELPDKDKVGTFLKSIKGPAAKTFVYSFIPSDSDVLEKFPEVKRKRMIQIQALNEVSSEIKFPVEYIRKHIRNAIVDHYQTNPEQILHDIANGKDNEIQVVLTEGFNGLGIGGSIDLSAIASIVGAGASIVTAFKKPNAPAATDYPKQSAPSQPQIVVIPPQQNVTKDPAYEKQQDNTGLYIGLVVAGIGVIGGGIAIAMR